MVKLGSLSIKPDSSIAVVEANTERRLAAFKELLAEYAASLRIDLCFQNFDEELSSLPGRYAPPEGGMWLALRADKVMGCIALRRWEDGVCEMKRLFVRPEYRGQGVGRLLAQKTIEEACALGYSKMRLDTVESMSEARKLYASLGFAEIEAYTHNPIEGARYMELSL